MIPPARPLRIPPFRGEIAGDWDLPEVRALISGIDSALREPGVRILHAGRNTVTAVSLPDAAGGRREIAVKEFRTRGLARLKTLWAASKSRKAWRGANLLAEAGLLTAAPIAHFESRKKSGVGRDFFLAGRLGEGAEIRVLLRDSSGDSLRPLLAGLARTIRLGHDRGVLHRDLSDGNVLVAGGGDAAYRFYFLDTNRVRRRRRLGRFARAKNLVRLGVPPALRRAFLAAYAGEEGLRGSFAFFYGTSKAFFEGWLRFKKKARLRRWARRLKIQ